MSDPARSSLTVREMRPDDVALADATYRLAFGTAFRLPDPTKFRGDGHVLGHRRALWPEASLVALVDDTLVGSITGMRWGSAVILGPITVHPAQWNGGVARALLTRWMALEEVVRARFVGLFTFPDSAKHIGLYESLGFAPRLLTAVLSKPPSHARPPVTVRALDAGARAAAIAQCRALSGSLYPGLDLCDEIDAVDRLRLGETVLVHDSDGAVCGFAVCHAGAGTEAGSGLLFVKFAAARDADAFARLLDACEGLAGALGAKALRAGVNTARREAYAYMRAHGYRIDLTGLAMHRPDDAAWSRPGIYVLDDWR